MQYTYTLMTDIPLNLSTRITTTKMEQKKKMTDTLQHFMAKFQPTMVIVGLGLNEVFARDVEKRKKYVDIINQKIDSAGAKVFWMGPAA